MPRPIPLPGFCCVTRQVMWCSTLGCLALHDAVWVPACPALCCMQGKRVWGLPPHSLALPDPRQASQLTDHTPFPAVQAVQEAVQEAVQDAVQEVRP